MEYEVGKALERHEELLNAIVQVLKDKGLIEEEAEEKKGGKK